MKQNLFVVAIFFFGFTTGNDQTGSKSEYKAGNALFINKKYTDALTHYHKAIELDPDNYQAIFRRSTTYFAIGRTKPGLSDLDTVLEQKPDFVGARQQRINVLMKLGRLEDAAQDLKYLNAITPSNEGIHSKLELIDQHQDDINALKSFAIGENCDVVDEVTSKLLEDHPWDSFLYILRGQCHKAENRLKLAIHDFKHASKLSSDNTDLLYDMSVLEYEVGNVRDALSSIRDCLKLNPDHKKCYSSYKSLRKIVKALDSMKNSIENEQWSSCLETGAKLLQSDNQELVVKINVYRLTCRCNREEGNIGTAVQECSEALEFDDADVDTLIQRAETYMADEEYDLAIADYEKVIEWDSSSETAKSGKEQAKRAKELVGQRDYYKILGVKRNANKREITKAYRKMAQKWHPDNFQNEQEKKKAEKKFIDIAAAKEVLSDEEKRRAFDNGQDPLDSEKGHHGHRGGGGGFNGFHGFNPFGRGSQEFFFHF
ncbi:hypothetical protein B9Z55_001040 [Caenorhabditis nigoni]|uniref:J domain-containing protein n=1 Tax=Caenorhabditis nigoni TaxID=1611254 RepID=A0A2G5VDV8_9PELO|nr:hypothetical protein B9Z55_001040 [Caenorhabditis nigoni]